MSPLTITTRAAATGPVLGIIGDLDYATAPGLRDALDGLSLTTGQLLVLDLAGLEFCDSSGISALLSARIQAVGQGARISLVSVPANTARVLGILGLDQVFAIDLGAGQAARHDPLTG
ncbi:STAS domain-containing protein [Streptomyces sp. NBC_01218]|uniref:STAS domain-containing protein n=1 Tax=unclassified Streptomyces TaxID=2593676 RepID=UPI0023B9AB0A|nr:MULTISPECIES: STAS domain-containing protein [unclassified Streptomyces]WEH40310.1 STAS domain-containing protein [Streptomyces sp. AM 2-1-1]WSQ52002.1 STAS domain-containing protein [Streptomyces sp. NBC_01218]